MQSFSTSFIRFLPCRCLLVALIGTGLAGCRSERAMFGKAAVPVVVVEGTTSFADSGERVLAHQLAGRLGVWLNQLGIPHKQVSDEDVVGGALCGCKVALLPYNPQPRAAERDILKRFVKSGGRLVVFYGTDPVLAKAMGMKLGLHRKAVLPGQWAAIHFNEAAPKLIPEIVRQDSRHLVPVYPDSDSARVIAYWQNEAGQLSPEPAWVSSPAGFWMSHVLMDGDDTAKRQLLLALLGAMLPDTWRTAAEYSLHGDEPFGEYRSLTEALKALTQQRPAPSPELQGCVGKVSALRAKALDLLRRHHDREAYEAARDLRNGLTDLYARRQRAPPGEFRGVWVDFDALGNAATWMRMCETLHANGFNSVFAHMGSPAGVHYVSQILPPSETLHRYGDQLNLGVSATRALGMELHAWIDGCYLEELSDDALRSLHVNGRLQVSDTGEATPWLCPSDPANRALLRALILELGAKTNLAGIQLDYLRYKNAHYCYCDGCRKRFETYLGRPLAKWPDDVLRPPLADRYRQWRSDQLTSLISDLRSGLRQVKPGIRLSAAVYGAYPACIAGVGQDWAAWLDQGAVDFVCPMDYVQTLDGFEQLIQTHLKATPAAHRIYPGLGVTTGDTLLTPDEVLAQIGAVRQQGLPGFVLFHYNPELARDYLPRVKAGESSP